jgi:hypothetical protein
MPVYDVELSDGRRFQVEGDSEPNEQDVLSALKGYQQEEPPSALKTGVETALTGVAPAAAAAAGAETVGELGSVLGPWGTLGGAVLGGLGMGALAEFGQSAALQKFAPEWMRKLAAGQQAHPIPAALGNLASAATSFTVAPGQAIRAGAALPKLFGGDLAPAELHALKGTAANLGAQLGLTGAQSAIQGRLPTPSELLENAAFATLYGRPRFGVPLPESLHNKLAETYASRISKAAKVHGDVQTQPVESQGQVPAQESGGRVQPQAQEVAQPAQVPLATPPPIPQITGSDSYGWTLHFQGKSEPDFETRAEAELAAQEVMAGTREMGGEVTPKEEETTPRLKRVQVKAKEAQDIVERAERAAIDGGAQPTEEPAPEKPPDDTVPFAAGGKFMWATGDGVKMNRAAFRKWIQRAIYEGVPEARIMEMVDRRLNEEAIHNKVKATVGDEGALAYWKDLTSVEQAIESYTYLKDRTHAGVPDTEMGHEAIRRRIQQLEQLEPSEMVEVMGPERWTLKSLEAISGIIRRVRESLGTKASQRQLEILGKVDKNISIARAVLGHTQPGARLRKDRGAEGQGEMFEGVPLATPQQIPPMPPEPTQRELGLKQSEIRDAHLTKGARDILDQGGDYQGFKQWIRGHFGQTFSSGETFGKWMDAVVRKLESASGAELQKMIKDMGLQFAVYPWKWVAKNVVGPEGRERVIREKQYTPIAIPDAHEYRAIPTTGPAQPQKGVSEMFKAFEEFQKREALKRGEKLSLEAPRSVEEPKPGQAKATEEERRKAIVSGQRTRAKALSAIYRRTVEQSMPSASDVDIHRTDIHVEDLDWSHKSTVAGVWHKVTLKEREDLSKLRDVVADNARRNSFDPVSWTKRIMVMRNKRNGEVALVSAYPHGRSDINVMHPYGTGIKDKPNISFENLPKEWVPEYVGLLREPVQNFRKTFNNYTSFHEYLGKAADEAEVNSFRVWLGLDPEGALPAHEAMAMEEGPREMDVAHMRWVPPHEGAGPEGEEITMRPGTGVTEGEGTTFMGPHADIYREGPGQIRARAPLSQHEVMALHEFLTEEMPVKSQDRMQEVVGRLAEKANLKSLTAKNWSAISALRKAADAEYAKLWSDVMDQRQRLAGGSREMERVARKRIPDPTREEAYSAALFKLYEITQNSKDPVEFLAQTMERFGRQAREAGAAGAAAVPGAPLQLPAEGTGQELTMRERRAPTESDWQGPPRPPTAAEATERPEDVLTSEGQKYVEALARQEHPYAPTQTLAGAPVTPGTVGGPKFMGKIPGVPRVMPHERAMGVRTHGTRPGARMRGITPEIERMWEDLGEWSVKFHAPFTRANVGAEILGTGDGMERLTERYGAENAETIRLASVKTPVGEPKVSFWQKVKGGPTMTPEAKQVRRSARAIPAAMQVLEAERWSNVAQAWAKQRKEEQEYRDRHRKVPERDPAAMPKFVKPTAADLGPIHFTRLVEMADKAIAMAQAKARSLSPGERYVGRRWLKSAQQLRQDATYAKDHFKDPEMMNTYHAFAKVMADHLAKLHEHGINISSRDYYVPGLFEGDIWADHTLLWGGLRILGTQYRLPKSFANAWEAIAAGPYMPVNADIADLAQHSLTRGAQQFSRDIWMDSLKSYTDEISGKPVAIEPVWKKIGRNPAKAEKMAEVAKQAIAQSPLKEAEGFKQEMESLALGALSDEYGWQVPPGEDNKNYSLVYASPASKPMAVREGYTALVRSVLAQSAIRTMPGGAQALMLAQMLKHGLVLILDLFHPDRLFQYAAALAGKNAWGAVPGWRGGHSALTYLPENLDRAVQIGAIPKAAADWVRRPIQVYDGGRTISTTHHQLLTYALSLGLNASRSADVLYRNAIQRIPFVGERWNKLLEPVNRWTFDKVTPGLIAENFVDNLLRTNAKSRNLSLREQMRVVIRDMNVFYGNLGRQGIFRNPTFRDIALTLVLAPLWQEGIIGKELRSLSRLTGLSWIAGRRGLGSNAYFGPLVRGMVRGLGAYFALTQVTNLITRGKFTWQNEEDNHKLDAWIPTPYEKPGSGVWLSPLSVFGEMLHDFMRLGESKPTVWGQIEQLGENKLGPLGRISRILREGKTPTGEVITSTGGVLGAAAAELAPTPISLGTLGKAAIHKVAPDVVAARKPGEVTQRLLGTAGVKVQTSTTAEQDIRRLATTFVRKQGLNHEAMIFTPTDEASFAKLRGAIRNEDYATAARLLRELKLRYTGEQGEQKIVHAMREGSVRPFTGSAANERLFRYSLNDHELEKYFQANMLRSEEFQKFLNFYVTQP